MISTTNPAEYIYVMVMNTFNNPVRPKNHPVIASSIILIDDIPDSIETEIIYEGSFWNDIEGFDRVLFDRYHEMWDLRSTSWEYPDDNRFRYPDVSYIGTNGKPVYKDVLLRPNCILIDKDYRFHRFKSQRNDSFWQAYGIGRIKFNPI